MDSDGGGGGGLSASASGTTGKLLKSRKSSELVNNPSFNITQAIKYSAFYIMINKRGVKT